MNVAVRAISQGIFLPSFFSKTSVGKKQFYLTSLFFTVLLSAFTLIYVKDVNRRLQGNLQMLQNAEINLHSQWSRLLLEEGAWSSKVRVEKIAHNQLGMILPKTKSIVTI